MFFRNLTLFRLDAEAARDVKGRLPAALDDHALFPAGSTAGPSIGAMEMSRSGFVPPIGELGAPLTYGQGNYITFCVATDTKLMPASVVNEGVRRKVAEIQERDDRHVRARERRRIKSDLIDAWLPRAFVQRTMTAGYIDIVHGWLVIDTASRRRAELVVNQLREALGTFPAVPLAPNAFPRRLLTDWLGHDDLPSGLTLGDECALRDMANPAGSSLITYKNVDLTGDDVTESLRLGNHVTKLGLTLGDRASFVLGDDLVVRRFRLSDVVFDERSDNARNTEELAQADFALLTGEVDQLLIRLAKWFDIPRPKVDGPLTLDREDAPPAMVAAARAAGRLDAMARREGATVTLSMGDGTHIATFGAANHPSSPTAERQP